MINTAHLRVPIASLLLLGLAAPSAAQTTWTVDDDPGPGVDFQTIGEAVAAAAPRDLINVLAGGYPHFDVGIPVTIMGAPGVSVSGVSRVLNTPAGSHCVLADMSMERLAVSACAGTVLLDQLQLTAGGDSLRVDASADVRGRAVNAVTGPATSSAPSLCHVSDSRVQLDECGFIAGRVAGIGPGDEPNGQVGLIAVDGSFVHLSTCLITGGTGVNYNGPNGMGLPGSGASGVNSDGSSIRLVQCTVRGGGGGLHATNPGQDGVNAAAFKACGGLHDVWDTALLGGFTVFSAQPPGGARDFLCGATLSGGAIFPALKVIGNSPTVGTQVGIRITAQAGSQAEIVLGRNPVLLSDAPSRIPQLVERSRPVNLGPMSASGTRVLLFQIPSLQRGTLIHLQAVRNGLTTGKENSNSQTIVVR